MIPRLATPADVPALGQLIEASVRGLSGGFYTPAQVEAALADVFGVDTQLVADGTYFVIDGPSGPVAAGGWSARRTLYGGDQMKGGDDPRLDPATEPARIRAFFVHPDWSRRGLARRLYDECARAAGAAGFRRLELMATLPGEPLYAALGFAATERSVLTLAGGVEVPLVRMTRELEPTMTGESSLEECLPAHLRGPATTIARVAAGLSGAGVYRVDAGGASFVLKKSAEGTDVADWRRTLGTQRRAAEAGLAPDVVHADEVRLAVVSAFVADRSFAALLGDPHTRGEAIARLGRTMRRVHALPIPAGAATKGARPMLATAAESLAGVEVPGFVTETVERVLVEEAPAAERDPVLSHNDVNPSNLVYDGERVLLLDWDAAGPNDPLWDLAVPSVFYRMDEGDCRTLLGAYDGEPVAELPAGFAYDRRLVGALCGAGFLLLARQSGHDGRAGRETLDSAPSLLDVYQRLRSGSLSLATADGRWAFGLALVKSVAR